jgi:hypothetical protein
VILLAATLPPGASAADPAPAFDEPVNPVILHQGWQMVSFPVLESKPLDDLDLISADLEVRQTFAEASAPGEPWVDPQLWWYDTTTQGYQIVGLGDSIEPNRGYWVYSYRDDAIYMVPTFDVTDCFQHQMGSVAMMDALTNGYAETYGITMIVEPESDICGLLCNGWYTVAAPLAGGDLYDEYRAWLGFGATGLQYAGVDYPGISTARFDPPFLVPNRMYPGETSTQTVASMQECGGQAIDSTTHSVRCLGPAMISTNLGDMVCLKIEETTEASGGSTRELRWLAPPLGDAQHLHWADGVLNSVETVSAWWP